MRILVVEPGKAPAERQITDTLDSMQEVVGGMIQELYIAEDIVIICNEEGKLLGLPLNRAIFDQETQRIREIIAGTFFVCGAPADSESFASLTDEQIQTYRKRFAAPEQFINLGGDIFVLPRFL